MFAIIANLSYSAQCDVTFNMYDSFGDGWNGSTVDITVNGATVVTGATIASGSFDSVVVPANIGDAVALATWVTVHGLVK